MKTETGAILWADVMAECIREKEKVGGHGQDDTLLLCLDVPSPQGHQRAAGEVPSKGGP